MSPTRRTATLSRGDGDLSEMKNAYIHCLECGQCELKCPNTMFGGDFYRVTTTTVDLVRKMRRDLHAQGIDYDGFEEVQKVIDDFKAHDAGPDAELTSWAAGLDLPFEGETMMFVDYYNAFQTREVPIAAAKILKAAGVKFGILKHPHITTGELYETDEDASSSSRTMSTTSSKTERSSSSSRTTKRSRSMILAA